MPSYWRSSFCAHLFTQRIIRSESLLDGQAVLRDGVLRIFWDLFVTLSALEKDFLIPSLIFSINIIPYFSRKVKSSLVTPRAETKSAREGVERKSAGWLSRSCFGYSLRRGRDTYGVFTHTSDAACHYAPAYYCANSQR